MANWLWQDYLILASFTASSLGILLLVNGKQTPESEIEGTEQTLLMMIFAYWIVHCVAKLSQKVFLPEWELLLINLKVTAALSYLITFACVLSVPLHRIAARQQLDEN